MYRKLFMPKRGFLRPAQIYRIDWLSPPALPAGGKKAEQAGRVTESLAGKFVGERLTAMPPQGPSPQPPPQGCTAGSLQLQSQAKKSRGGGGKSVPVSREKGDRVHAQWKLPKGTGRHGRHRQARVQCCCHAHSTPPFLLMLFAKQNICLQHSPSFFPFSQSPAQREVSCFTRI